MLVKTNGSFMGFPVGLHCSCISEEEKLSESLFHNELKICLSMFVRYGNSVKSMNWPRTIKSISSEPIFKIV